MKTLRPYQAEATASTFGYFAKSNGNPLIIAPVAAGKSLLMAEFITQACRLYHGTRILVLAHNKELLQQNEAELKEQWPEVETGFYCAGLGKKVKAAPITFASIQSSRAST
jgi:superfamily II DNA or RNA helicase